MSRRTAGVRVNRWRGGLVVSALAVTACAAGADDAEVAAPIATAAPTAPPTTLPAPVGDGVSASTTVPPTLAPTTIATVPPTTAAATTTTVEIPITIALEHGEQATTPIAPPTDEYAEEPVLEMGTLSIPKLDVSMTMFEGVRLTTLELGPGHWPGSALPGRAGNVVVGGHRVSGHAVFRHVDQLDAGDEIVFEDADGRHVYSVREVRIIDPYDVWIVDPTPTPTATLFACHPPGSTAQRIAVFADLVTG